MMTNSIVKQTQSLALMLGLAMVAMLMPDMAHASGTAIANVLCTVVGWFTGPVGKGIATLAIIVIGIGALMGKVSWGMAIIVGVGVAVVFGAPEIVGELGAEQDGCEGSSYAANGTFTFNN